MVPPYGYASACHSNTAGLRAQFTCGNTFGDVDRATYLCFYVIMRSTIDLPDELFRRVKAHSSLRGMSLKKFITMAVEHELEVNPVRFESRRVRLPLVPSERPGSVAVDADRIAEILEREDLNVSS